MEQKILSALEDIREAKMLFEKILELEPRWEKPLTEPYLKKMSNE